MCGIAGVAVFNGAPLDVDGVRAMTVRLAHRGPDGDGLHVAGNVALGHRRLAIIDPAAGQQPLLNDDGKVALSYNGELYNYVELRGELAGRFRFRTQCDTEVVLRAWEEWGPACIDRFRGMFAFAIVDGRCGELHLVRDRVGIKPLYVARVGDRLAFSSEFAPLLALDWVPREIDCEALAEYLRSLCVPAPRTIYRHVRKLMPGEHLRVRLADGATVSRHYWQLRPSEDGPRGERALRELDALLGESVDLHLRSDVPFGAFLSGGVDSGLVAALMGSRLSTLRTYSIGFGVEEANELPQARAAATALGARHTERVVSAEVALPLLGAIARHFGEPFADSSAVPTYHVSELAATDVKMVLSGDGGDELFSGYESHRAVHDALRPDGLLRRLRAAFRPRPDVRAMQDGLRSLYDDAEIERLLGRPAPPRRRLAGLTLDPVIEYSAEDFTWYLPDDVLTKVDRMSMACSLEVRVPLLDHKLVEFAFSLPVAEKVAGRGDRIRTKHLLKQAARAYYPDEHVDRPKRGFGIPVADWCSGGLRAHFLERFEDASNPVFDLVERDAAQTIVRAATAGHAASGSRAWSLLMLDQWLHEVHAV